MLDPLLELTDVGDLADDVRRLFDELERSRPECRGMSGECAPEVDVIETPDGFQILVDLPGVGADSVRVFFKRGAIIIAGQKMPPGATALGTATFHRIERGFGRFARAIRLPGAIDATRARASMRVGELRLIVPKIQDRREREINIPID